MTNPPAPEGQQLYRFPTPSTRRLHGDGDRTAEGPGSPRRPGALPWYALAATEVARLLGVVPEAGLASGEAAARLARDGPNTLPEERPVRAWLRFLRQYRSYMQLILVASAVVCLAIRQWTTAVLLVVITVVNAVVGLRQESKAESAMNALRSMMKTSARARRDGLDADVDAEDVVVGDVVLLSAGGQVPADGRVLSASALQIDESALTGESTPAAKDSDLLAGRDLSPGEQTNMAFMNTPVTHGSGTMVVTATGVDTEIGRISGMLAATATETSPLTRQMNNLTLWIAGAAGFTMVVMFALGRQRGEAWDALFVAAVSLAIAAIPEALPTVAQVILSVGGSELAARNAIVKDLPSVESLGFTSAVNSDKTGTLTMNELTVVDLVTAAGHYTLSGHGYGLEGRLHHVAGRAAPADADIAPYVIANDAGLVEGQAVGDPTERALLVLAHKAGLDIDATRQALPRLATLPFDPTHKLMATFNEAVDPSGDTVVRCFVKGAAPAVLARVAAPATDGSPPSWPGPDEARAEMLEMERRGERVMAAAVRDIEPSGFDPSGDLLAYVDRLELTSIVGMLDPLRSESKEAVASAQAAHIRVRMVTGDDVTTGAAIARELGIPGEAVLGADFAGLSPAERLARIDQIGVIGRVAPEHKVMVAETLKHKGEVVAMTGDGVNDAPAIKAADIGIAMGTGTDVAKSAGRMILSDDNFATIVYAVEQGRKIYDNLTKYIRFVLVLLVTFVLTFLGAAVFNIASGEPFSAAQVLWIHFVVNAPFGFALGFDRASPGLMSRHPRPRGQSVLTWPLVATAGLAGLTITVGLLGLVHAGTALFGSTRIGQSIALTSFAFCLIVAAFECRSETATALTEDSFDSRQMNRAALVQVALAVLVTQLDALRRLLGTTELDMRQFAWALVPAIGLLLLWELAKLVARWHGPHLATAAPAPAAGRR